MEEQDSFDEKMKNMYLNFHEYCVSQNHTNIDFLNGCLNIILVLFKEQENDKERTHFKNHVFKILFDCFGLLEKSNEVTEDK